MPRTKDGTVTRARHKKIMKLAKGYRGSKHLQFKATNTQVFISRKYAFRDHKKHKSEFKELWIAHVSAATRQNGLSYFKLMRSLKIVSIDTNREVLADITYNDEKAFADLANAAKKALN